MEDYLIAIENHLLSNSDTKPNFSNESFRAISYIFLTAIIDKLFDLQMNEGIELEDSKKMAESCGNELKKFVKIYTGIDTEEFY